jgi:hypothetical protein
MELESLKEVIMRRDRITAEEAEELICDARNRVLDGEDPEDILYNDFGLEPDYVFDIMPY